MTTKKKNPRTPLSKYTDAEIFAESGRRTAANRDTPPRAKVLRPCPRCGKEFGARDMRVHLPTCPKV
jgi:hypothetical protein